MIFYQEDNSLGNYNYNIFTYTDSEWSMHFHKNFEILYGVKGKTTATINGISGVLKEGEFAIVLPNQLHSFSCGKESKVWVGVFSEDFITEFAKAVAKKEGLKLSFRCTPEELEYLKTSLLSESDLSILSLKSSLYMICNRYTVEVPLVDASSTASDVPHTIIKYLEDHFTENVTLGDVSRELGYEYHYLSRLFKSTFRISFKDMLNRYRFEYAKHLILSTDKSLCDIAFECGFGSTRNFNRVYRSYAHVTPSELRQGV